MRDKKHSLCILLILLLLTACNHNEKESITLNKEHPELTVTITPRPTVTSMPSPNDGVTPDADTSSPSPTKESDESEKNIKVTPTPTLIPIVTPTPEPTPIVSIVPTPTPMMTPTATPMPAVTTTPTPTQMPVNLGTAHLIDVVGSNMEVSFNSKIIKNPLKLSADQSILRKRLLTLVPSLSTFKRIDTESYEWNYNKTSDGIPVVNLVRNISSEGKNSQEQTIYYAGMNFNSEISDEPSGITLILNAGFETSEDGNMLAGNILSGILPEELIRELLKEGGEKNGATEYINSNKIYYEDTPFYLEFKKEEYINTDESRNDGLKLSLTAHRSRLLYTAYREGLILHKEQFNEFPMEFSDFFTVLDPFHTFNTVKYTKQISYGEKTITAYTAEFSGYDTEGSPVTIIVSMDDTQGEYTICGFRYYTFRDFIGDNELSNQKIILDYYTEYLNKIMTLATFKTEEFKDATVGSKSSILKDVTVSGYTLPCKVTVSEGNLREEVAFTGYLDIEYARQ